MNWCTASQFVSSEDSREAGRVDALDVDETVLHGFGGIRISEGTIGQNGFDVFTFGQSSRTDCANAYPMKDMHAHLEKRANFVHSAANSSQPSLKGKGLTVIRSIWWHISACSR
jgi:hypothetical protein